MNEAQPTRPTPSQPPGVAFVESIEPISTHDPTPLAGASSVVPSGSGQRYGRFAVQRFHAKGGLGELHIAMDEELRRDVVLKRIQERFANDPSARRRFLNEAEITARLEHPGIVPIYGLVQDEHGQPCYAMRFIQGQSLAEAIKKWHDKAAADYTSLAFRQLLQRFISVCQTMAYAHSKHVIHRDLKPANVMLGRFGETMVVDWGLARELAVSRCAETARQSAEDEVPPTVNVTPSSSGERIYTQAGQALGTPGYMAPEQAAGRWKVVGPCSDIWSLGATLYEIVTGVRAVRGQDVFEVLQKAQGNEFTAPRQVKSDVPRALEAVCLKAMAREPANRYASANELAADIEHWLADEPVSALAEPWTQRAQRWLRKHRGVVRGVGALLLTTVVGLSIGLAALEQERAQTASERDQKGKALEAETKARASERQARDQAMAALRDLTDNVVEGQMARSARLSEDSKEFLRKIVKHFEGFAALTADDAESRAIRAEGYRRVGRIRHRLGESKEAETAFRDALALQKQLVADYPARAEFREELATDYNSMGILFETTGRVNDAETSYREAAAIRKQLVADFPQRPELRRQLATNRKNLGSLLRDTGRQQAAEAEFGEAVALATQLAADFPSRPEFRSLLAGLHNSLANLRYNMGRLKDAYTAYHEAMTVWKQLDVDFPNRVEYRQSLAGCYHNLGLVLFDTGSVKDAEAAHSAALAIQLQLTAIFPTMPELRQDLALTYNSLGIIRGMTGRLQEAESAYNDSLNLRKRLATDYPNQPSLRNDLAEALGSLANLRIERRDFPGAKACLEEAQPHHQAALKANPRHPAYRNSYRSYLMNMTLAQAGLLDQAAAVTTAESVRDLEWDRPINAYAAACALARCITIAEKADGLDAAQRQAAVEFYSERAMVMLRDAVAKGYKDIAHLKNDADLKLLRERPDYQKLVKELEDKK